NILLGQTHCLDCGRLHDHAVRRLEYRHACISLTRAGLVSNRSVLRRDIAAGISNLQEKILWREPPRDASEIGTDGTCARVTGLATALDKKAFASPRVALLPRNAAQYIRPIRGIFTFARLEIAHEARIMFAE